MKKFISRFLTLSFLCGIMIWMAVVPDKEYSEQENRYLAQFPVIRVENVMNAEFMDRFETYLTDQFPARNACINIKTAVFRATGQRLISNIYLADDNYLIKKQSAYDEEELDIIIQSVNKFAETLEGVDVDFMLVPTAENIYEDKLPYTAETKENETMEYVYNRISGDIEIIDVRAAIDAKKDLGMYYKTDHHWTSRGAYEAFKVYAKRNKLEMVDYEFYAVTDEFQGTGASGCGIYDTSDVIEICVPENAGGTYFVHYINEMKKTASLFDSSKLAVKDKYQVFMGGNFAEVDIKTNAGTGNKIMVIKDSYGNSFVPLLTPYYDEIIVIDPRYYSGDIYELVQYKKINQVLFLYNTDSFITDNCLEIMAEEQVYE